MLETHVSAVTFVDDDRQILSVRRRDVTNLMQPGDKPEPGEFPTDAAIREVREERGLDLTPVALTYLGRHSAPAAKEAGFTVVGDVFVAPLPGTPTSHAEIAELRWVPLDTELDDTYTELIRTEVMPAVCAHLAP